MSSKKSIDKLFEQHYTHIVKCVKPHQHFTVGELYPAIAYDVRSWKIFIDDEPESVDEGSRYVSLDDDDFKKHFQPQYGIPDGPRGLGGFQVANEA